MVAAEHPSRVARPLTPDHGSPSLPPHPITQEEIELWQAGHSAETYELGALVELSGFPRRTLRNGPSSTEMFRAAREINGVTVTSGGVVVFTPQGLERAAMIVGYSNQTWQERERLLAEEHRAREAQQNIVGRRRLNEELRGPLTLPDEEAVVLADAILGAYDPDRGQTLRNNHINIRFDPHWREAREALVILRDVHVDPDRLNAICNSLQDNLRALVTNRTEFLRQNTLVRELLGLFINVAGNTQLLRTKIDFLVLTPYKNSIRAKVRESRDFSLPFHTFQA